jgi:hypothetical protein
LVGRANSKSNSKSKSFHESEMARSWECTEQYAQKVLDTAGIVRDAMFRQKQMSILTGRGQRLDFTKIEKDAWYFARGIVCTIGNYHIAFDPKGSLCLIEYGTVRLYGIRVKTNCHRQAACRKLWNTKRAIFYLHIAVALSESDNEPLVVLTFSQRDTLFKEPVRNIWII